MGHLNEARVPTCNLNESDIKLVSYQDGKEQTHYKFQIGFEMPENSVGDGVCRDFKITPEVKNSLIDKITKELNSG